MQKYAAQCTSLFMFWKAGSRPTSCSPFYNCFQFCLMQRRYLMVSADWYKFSDCAPAGGLLAHAPVHPFQRHANGQEERPTAKLMSYIARADFNARQVRLSSGTGCSGVAVSAPQHLEVPGFVSASQASLLVILLSSGIAASSNTA